MVMVSVKGKTWYRIRAGSFPSKRAATQAAGIFHTAYGFDAIAVQQ
jgi:cell division protein FtsN